MWRHGFTIAIGDLLKSPLTPVGEYGYKSQRACPFQNCKRVRIQICHSSRPPQNLKLELRHSLRRGIGSGRRLNATLWRRRMHSYRELPEFIANWRRRQTMPIRRRFPKILAHSRSSEFLEIFGSVKI